MLDWFQLQSLFMKWHTTDQYLFQQIKFTEIIKDSLLNTEKSIDPQLSDKIEAIEMYNTSQSASDFNTDKLKKRIANYDITYEEEGGNEDGTI